MTNNNTTAAVLTKHEDRFPKLPPPSADLYDRQDELEDACRLKGVERYRDKNKPLDARAPGLSLRDRIVWPLIDLISAARAEAKAKRKGRPQGWHGPIKLLDAPSLAVIAAQAALQRTVPEINDDTGERASGTPKTELAIAIGEEVYAVARERAWVKAARAESKADHEANGQIGDALEKSIRADVSYRRHADAEDDASLTAHLGHEPTKGEIKNHHKLGDKLIDLMVEAAPDAFELSEESFCRDKRVKRWELCLTDRAADNLLDLKTRDESATPSLLPMLVPPKAWRWRNGVAVGGYRKLKQDLIRADLDRHTKDLPEPVSRFDLDALNVIAATRWKINGRVLDAMRAAFDASEPWLELRDGSAYPEEPEGPYPFAEWKELPAEVKAPLEAAIKEHDRALRDRRERAIRTAEMANQLIVAKLFRNEAAIWFPWHRDYRGRTYPVPVSAMHPQSDDAGRALLEFADALPLGEHGLHWLCWQAATHFGHGYDKAPEAERVAWTDSHRAEIETVAAGDTWWQGAEAPWQFYAVCRELAEAWKGNPAEFASRLPVAFDCTASGLQILCCLAGDADGAAKVNLGDGADQRQDIYAIVAEAVDIITVQDAYLCGHQHAASWVGRVTRGLLKQPVMTTAYGSTKDGIRRQIRDYLRKEGIDLGDAEILYMAEVIDSVREAELLNEMAVMKWLQKTFRKRAEDGYAVVWTTPNDSRVRQSVHKKKSVKARTASGAASLQWPLPELDPDGQANASAPNLVHSLDACLECSEVHGIYAVQMIHDCYGCHARHAETLRNVVQRQFEALYQADHLAQLAAEIRRDSNEDTGIDDPPARGAFRPQNLGKFPFA